ncbi:MAG: 1-acyl-sn-glycerol-3-phosphate acyltransferase [Deltaproteobacteria bacterium]|nr:1-acyl-sn-glycerol-3-phosphate acyltransferase [Deltaproteobacteria bacterium]
MTINSLISFLVTALITPICSAAAVIWSHLDPSGNRSHLIARVWAKTLLMVSRVKVTIEGHDNLDPKGTYVFAANHSSVFDILVLLAGLPVQFRWLAKEELFHIPIFGLAMTKCGYIPVNRSSPRESVRSLRQAAARIRSGVSVIIFPEGTRSLDGRVGEFKRGGFTLAVLAGRPIIPVSINGAHEVMPAKSLRITPHPIRIVLGRPIPTQGLDRHGQDRLMEEVRQVIIKNCIPNSDSGRKN